MWFTLTHVTNTFSTVSPCPSLPLGAGGFTPPEKISVSKSLNLPFLSANELSSKRKKKILVSGAH